MFKAWGGAVFIHIAGPGNPQTKNLRWGFYPLLRLSGNAKCKEHSAKGEADEVNGLPLLLLPGASCLILVFT
jgi:hypothetical protein